MSVEQFDLAIAWVLRAGALIIVTGVALVTSITVLWAIARVLQEAVRKWTGRKSGGG